jgi:serine/threonine protein kinase
MKLLYRETVLWRQLHHPNVLTFLGIDAETYPPYFCMVSPWMEHGTLKDYVNSSFYDIRQDRDRLVRAFLHSYDFYDEFHVLVV